MRQTRFGLPARAAAVGAALAAVLVGSLAVPPAAQASDIRSLQWYLDLMKAPQMWKVATGKGITVAVVDTGVNARQNELRGKVLPGTVIGGSGSAHTDRDGHGTSMAMLIAGDGLGGSGVQGLAPGARILPVVDNGQGFSTAAAILYAVDHGARIINVSEGSAVRTPRDDPKLASALEYAARHGSLVFAAVGNDGKTGEPVEAPASFPGAIGVAAVDKQLKVADFSNHGEHVVFAAPGVSIPADCSAELGSQKGYCLGEGTSEATAIASASAALIWSAHPGWTNNQVLRVMMQTAGAPAGAKLPSQYIGYGFVRPRLAVLGKVDPGPADVNPLYPALSGKPSTAPTTASGAGSASGATTPSASAPSQAAPKAGAKGSSALPWVGAGAGVVVVAAIVVFVAVRSRGRRRARAEGSQTAAPHVAVPPQGTSVPPQGYGPNPYATGQPDRQPPASQPPQQPYGTPQQPYGPSPQGYGQPPTGGGYGPPQS